MTMEEEQMTELQSKQAGARKETNVTWQQFSGQNSTQPLEEIQAIRNFPSFGKDKPQYKQLKELKEKYHKGQLTSEEKKLVKEIEVAVGEIHAMIKKKNLAKMICEMKKYQ